MRSSHLPDCTRLQQNHTQILFTGERRAMAVAKWSASEVAALLAAWRDALEAPKYRGFSVRQHMFDQFAERCGGATARALPSVCFKRETLRNMSDLICEYHAYIEKKLKLNSKHGDAAALDGDEAGLPWFSLSVADRKAWFANHNQRSYTFLDIDASMFLKVKALNEMMQRAEDVKRQCYRRVLLRKDDSGEWEVIREKNAGSWASAVELAAAVSNTRQTDSGATSPTPETAASSSAFMGDDEQSSIEDLPVPATTEHVTLASTIVISGGSVTAAVNSDADQSSDETQDEDGPTSSEYPQHHHGGDDDSATESDSDLEAWKEDEENNDEDGENNNSNAQDSFSQPEEGESNTVAVIETASPSQDVAESEKPEVIAAMPPVPSHPTIVRAEPISSRATSTFEKESHKPACHKQASPVVIVSVDNTQVEKAVLSQAAENPKGSGKEVSTHPVEKSNVPNVAAVNNIQHQRVVTSDQGHVYKDPRVPDQELLKVVSTLEKQTQLLKNMQTDVNRDRKRNQSTENRHVEQLRKLDQGMLELQMTVKGVEDNCRENLLVDAQRSRMLSQHIREIQTEGRDERLLLKKELDEMQAKWADCDAKRSREVEEFKLECAKLKKEASERDKLLAALQQELLEVRSWMKQVASNEATATSVAEPNQVALPATAAAAATTTGGATAANSEVAQKSIPEPNREAPPAAVAPSTIGSIPAVISEVTQISAAVQDRVAADSSSDLSADKRRGAETKSPVASDAERSRKRKRKRTLMGEVKALHDKFQARKVLAEKQLPSSEPNPKTVTEKPSSTDNRKLRIRSAEQPQKTTRARSFAENQDTNRVPVAQQPTKSHAIRANGQAEKQQKQLAIAPDAPAPPLTALPATSRAAKLKLSAKQRIAEPEQEEPHVAPTYRTRSSRSRTKGNAV